MGKVSSLLLVLLFLMPISGFSQDRRDRGDRREQRVQRQVQERHRNENFRRQEVRRQFELNRRHGYPYNYNRPGYHPNYYRRPVHFVCRPGHWVWSIRWQRQFWVAGFCNVRGHYHR